jgi:hypothetical protein
VGQLTRLVGQKFAVQLHENANGRDDSPVETEVQEAKSYSAERTFPKDLSDPKDIDRALFNVACIVAHRIRRDGFRASTVSMFIKYSDFSVAQRQCQTGQPTDITAVILNEARRMLPEVWDGVSPLRQVGLGVSKLTHETTEQMSLFEDPKMEYYREWDRQYDAERARAEDARLLAYERKKPAPEPLLFRYSDGEKALAAAKSAVRSDPSLRLHRVTLADGSDCFELHRDGKVVERHAVQAG